MSIDAPTASAPAPVPESEELRRNRRRVLASGYLGSTLEYYDFLLYATASAVVFSRLFFADLDPVLGTIASFATFAVGYLVRPIGAILFGHFGDKYGRKRMLVFTLLLMGGASTLIGLLPTQPMVGALAPLLLILLRIVQGLAMSGEWGGATIMALEYAKDRRRGLATSIIAAGAPSGSLLASGALGLAALLPEEDFLGWGWRIPFLISALLVAIALWIRLRINESPRFLEAKAKRAASGEKERIPFVEALRHWRKLVLVVLAGIGPHAYRTLTTAFLISQAIGHGLTDAEALWASTAASFINLFSITLFGRLNDRIGRKRVLFGGLVIGVLTAWPLVMLATSGSFWLAFLAFMFSSVFIHAATLPALGTLVTESFPTRARYTGATLGYQIASALGAGLAPLLAATLMRETGGDLGALTLLIVGVLVVGLIGTLFLRETYKDKLED